MACSWEQAFSMEVFYNAAIGECACGLTVLAVVS